MKVITESSTNEYNKKYYITYNDKELNIEESCERGENKISYNFHRSGKYVEQTVDPDQNTSVFTAAYFEYINKYATIPTFRVSPDSKHGLNFNMIDENGNDYVMTFVAEIANHTDTYCMVLDEFGVYIFDKDVIDSNPYEMEKELLLEIFFNNKRDKLLFIDHDQREFYAIDCHYRRLLSGKLNKYFKIDSYIQDGERYDFMYDNKGELIYIGTFSRDKVLYIDKGNTWYNATYKIPYVITSYGAIISDPENPLFETRTRYSYGVENEDYEIETTVRQLTKEESKHFMDYVEKM